MSTALAKSSGSVVSIDLNNLNFDAASAAMERASNKAGLSGGTKTKLFPGVAYFFKKDTFKFGQGKDALDIDPPLLVVNVPHLAMAYMKFDTNPETGKMFPRYSELCVPVLGQDLVDRDSLGDTDPDDWDEMEGRPVDPWTLNIAIPVRIEGEADYNHILATNVTNQNALKGLFSEAMAEMKLRPGQLPVVQFSTRAISTSKKSVDKRGKTVTTKRDWSGMGYEIVGWTPVEPWDQLNQNVEMGEDDAKVERGAVTTTQRSPAQKALPAPSKPVAEKKAVAPTAPAKKGAKKRVADV